MADTYWVVLHKQQESEGNTTDIKMYWSEQEALDWIASQKGEWYSPSQYFVRKGPKDRSAWHPIETCPSTGDFLAYGSYLYPDDARETEYIEMASATGKEGWPIRTWEGECKDGVFSHWMYLPEPPRKPQPSTWKPLT